MHVQRGGDCQDDIGESVVMEGIQDSVSGGMDGLFHSGGIDRQDPIWEELGM